MDVDVPPNGSFEFPRAAVGGTLDLLLGDEPEEALNEIHPGSPGRSEMEMETGPFGEPVADQGSLVRSVVVEDQVDVEVFGYGFLDSVEELPELDRAMPPMQ